MPSLEQSCMIIVVSVLSVHSACSEYSELSDLLKTDIGGDLHSHMALAAHPGYEVSKEGIVTIDGERYEIWPEVRRIGYE